MWHSPLSGVASLFRRLIPQPKFPLLHAVLNSPHLSTPANQRGSIAGILYLDGSPAPEGTLVGCALSRGVDAPDDRDACGKHPFSVLLWNEYVKTDKHGRFLFKRIAAGEVQLGRAYELPPTRRTAAFAMDSEELLTMDQEVAVVVRPLESVQVELGRGGRTVSGRLMLPGSIALPDSFRVDLALLRSNLQDPVPPTDLAIEARESWRTEFDASDEGIAWRAACLRMYEVWIEPDGHFTMNNVHPGNYVLEIRLSRTLPIGADTACPMGDYTGLLPIGATEGPLDIGEIQLTPYTVRVVEDTLPEIRGARNREHIPLQWTTFEGQTLLLFLYFNLDDRNEDFLRAIGEAQLIASDRQPFSCIALCQADDVWSGQQLAKRTGVRLSWNYVSGSDSAAWSAPLGVRRSSVFLAGPDGRLVACDLDPTELLDRVRSILLPRLAG